MAKKQIAAGKDSSVQKRLDRIAAEAASRNTFALVAAEYLERLEANGAAPATLKKNRWFLEELRRLIADITPAEVLDLLQRIEKSGGRETAHRLRGHIQGALSSILRATVATRDDSHLTFQKISSRMSLFERVSGFP